MCKLTKKQLKNKYLKTTLTRTFFILHNYWKPCLLFYSSTRIWNLCHNLYTFQVFCILRNVFFILVEIYFIFWIQQSANNILQEGPEIKTNYKRNSSRYTVSSAQEESSTKCRNSQEKQLHIQVFSQ
jgi:hypothetical protein